MSCVGYAVVANEGANAGQVIKVNEYIMFTHIQVPCCLNVFYQWYIVNLWDNRRSCRRKHGMSRFTGCYAVTQLSAYIGNSHP